LPAEILVDSLSVRARKIGACCECNFAAPKLVQSHTETAQFEGHGETFVNDAAWCGIGRVSLIAYGVVGG